MAACPACGAEGWCGSCGACGFRRPPPRGTGDLSGYRYVRGESAPAPAPPARPAPSPHAAPPATRASPAPPARPAPQAPKAPAASPETGAVGGPVDGGFRYARCPRCGRPAGASAICEGCGGRIVAKKRKDDADAVRKCRECGHRNAADKTRCINCGTRLA